MIIHKFCYSSVYCKIHKTNRQNCSWKSKMFTEKNYFVQNLFYFEDNLHFEWNMCNLEDTWNPNKACD